MKFHLVSIAQHPVPIRLGAFIVVLLLLWIPIAAPIYWLIPDQNLVNILTLPLLYGEFILLLQCCSKYVYRQSHWWQCYGLEKTRRNGWELLVGLVIGITALKSMFLLEGWLNLLQWQQPAIFLPKLVLEGLTVALAYGFAEELLFRGWLLDELRRDYSASVVLWVNALLYAVAHFIKPLSEIIRTLPQFAGLFLLGLILVWAKRYRQDRLGLSIGIHAGLIWGYYIVNVGQLVQYSSQVPTWITGIDKNPLAGMIGLLFLGFIAFWMRRATKIHHKSQ